MIKKEMSWPICRDIPYNRHLSMAMGDYHDLPSPILPDPPPSPRTNVSLLSSIITELKRII